MSERVGIVGAGIVGLAHAWSAAKRGRSVTVFERTSQAQGASIRNFGMVWPIGQPAGERREIALRSRELWLEASQEAKFWCDPVGSLHLAYREDELAVLTEFVEKSSELGFDVELLKPEAVKDKSPAARRENLQGGLWSASEVCIDPREAIQQLPKWLAEKHGVQFQFGTTIKHVDGTTLIDAQDQRWETDRALVCSGADFETLFPEVFQQAGLLRCKLQMLRTVAQPNQWRIGPMLAGGLTLRHYPNFQVCSMLEPLKKRIAEESPKLNQFGIHVMASQNRLGEVVLGDSHEYGKDITPFDKAEIDELILVELFKMLELTDWKIAARWHGIYAKHPSEILFTAEPQSGVKIVTATGGTGMTMSFGLAETLWENEA